MSLACTHAYAWCCSATAPSQQQSGPQAFAIRMPNFACTLRFLQGGWVGGCSCVAQNNSDQCPRVMAGKTWDDVIGDGVQSHAMWRVSIATFLHLRGCAVLVHDGAAPVWDMLILLRVVRTGRSVAKRSRPAALCCTKHARLSSQRPRPAMCSIDSAQAPRFRCP